MKLFALAILALAPALCAAQGVPSGTNAGSSGVLRERPADTLPDGSSATRPAVPPAVVDPTVPTQTTPPALVPTRPGTPRGGAAVIDEPPDPALNPTSPAYRSDGNPVTDPDCGRTETNDDRSLPRRCLK